MMPSLAVLSAGAWLVLLLAAPLLPGPVGAVLYGVGSFVCHQIPERSFHLSGFQLPVCARCLGLYAGVAGGAFSYVWLGRASRAARAARTPRIARRLAGAAVLPTVFTVALEAVGVWDPSNFVRAAAGAAFGVVVGLVVISALATVHYGECVPPRPVVPKPPPTSI